MHEPLETSEDEAVPTIHHRRPPRQRLRRLRVPRFERHPHESGHARAGDGGSRVGRVCPECGRPLAPLRAGRARSPSRCRTSATRSTRRWSRRSRRSRGVAGVRLLLHSTGADSEDELAMIRDLRHRHVDGFQPGESHDLPCSVDLAPVARRPPLFVANRRETVHQPQRRRGVAAILHECEPLGVGDEVAREPDRSDQGAVRWLFIVEMEYFAGMPDGVDALIERDPFVGGAGSKREISMPDRKPAGSGFARTRAGCRSASTPDAAAHD